MQTFALLTSLTAAASAAAIGSCAAPSPAFDPSKAPFLLEVENTNGNVQYLSSYHAGAGRNYLIERADRSTATHFTFDKRSGFLQNVHSASDKYPNTAIIFNDNPKIKGYGSVEFNPGDVVSSLSFDKDNYLQFADNEVAGTTYAICREDPYVTGDFVPTLAFRTPDAKPDPACTDVKVKAIPV